MASYSIAVFVLTATSSACMRRRRPGPRPRPSPDAVRRRHRRRVAQLRPDLSNTRHQERERAISPADIPTLAPAWTFSPTASGGAGDFTGTPTVADGCVFAGSNGGGSTP